MNIAELWAEIEEEQTWRQDEIRFFQNQLGNLSSDNEKNKYRKALILLLYAHFEGFCKFAFSHYIKAINAENLSCGQANFAITASSLSDIFNELRNPDKKNPDFRNSLPDDAKLHRFARDKEFLEKSNAFDDRPLNISDTIVDMESNLKPIVMRKNLFKLGFPPDKFSALEGKIDKLLKYRNDIAHGAKISGIEERDYQTLRDEVNMITREIKREVMSALQFGKYLRT
jgi:RiboL-PSP-HEPN